MLFVTFMLFSSQAGHTRQLYGICICNNKRRFPNRSNRCSGPRNCRALRARRYFFLSASSSAVSLGVHAVTATNLLPTHPAFLVVAPRAEPEVRALVRVGPVVAQEAGLEVLDQAVEQVLDRVAALAQVVLAPGLWR